MIYLGIELHSALKAPLFPYHTAGNYILEDKGLITKKEEIYKYINICRQLYFHAKFTTMINTLHCLAIVRDKTAVENISEKVLINLSFTIYAMRIEHYSTFPFYDRFKEVLKLSSINS